jgi:NADH-quinone oxidoreductase subunit J
MTVVFYLAAIIAVAATVMVITRFNAVHALLYLIVSLLAVALVFFLLGAPFAAAMEVIIYAGAIMVLFVFVVMMLNLGPRTSDQERHWLRPGIWLGPGVLAGLLLAELIYILIHLQPMIAVAEVGPKQLALALFDPYLLGVELASLLLLAGLVGAYHLAQQPQNRLQRKGN